MADTLCLTSSRHREPDGGHSLSHLLNCAVARQKQLRMVPQCAQLCFSNALFMGSEIYIS